MESRGKSRTCCFFFDIKTGASAILGVEMAIPICGLVNVIYESIFHGTEITKIVAEEAFPSVLLSVLIPFICNITGLLGITKNKPGLLIPFFVYKILVFCGFVILCLYLSIFLPMFVDTHLDLLLVMILAMAYAIWIIYSTIVVYLCFKEMKIYSNRTEISFSASAQPYNQFVNQSA